MVGRLIEASSFAIVNAKLVTMAPLAQAGWTARVTPDDLGIIERGAVVVEDGIIASVTAKSSGAKHTKCGRANLFARSIEEIDAGGKVVMPGLIDAHTHALFAGDRIADFEAMAAGRPPQQGIRHTVEQTRRCSLSELVDIGERHLSLMASHGTTTAEVKTGYDLTAEGEARLLQAMAQLDGRSELPHVVPTFCGAHALPPEFSDYDAFVDELCTRILPQIASLNLARFADAFCERGYFSVAQSRRFLKACAARGLRLRLHADEMSASGGAKLAAELRCASADHLNYADEDDARALAAAKTIAVLCPTTAEYLDLPKRAPARLLIEAGVPVALGTDFNPGTSPCFSLQEAAHAARRRLQMTAPEVIAAVTAQAARSLGIEGEAGSMQPGKRADLILLAVRDYREFGYYFGGNLVEAVAVGKHAVL